MRLKDFLRADFVLSRLQAKDMEGVVDEVATLAGAVGVGPAEAIRAKLLERERLHPTIVGAGLAIPHATVPGLPAQVIGVALARDEPVVFGFPDQDPVKIFFVLLSPPGHEREHVKLLARVCRLVRHEGFMESLDAAPDEAEIVRIIEHIDAQHV
jgi:mannitol/fructose-specific phosphotransferase system IIA component (Ntr-type)